MEKAIEYIEKFHMIRPGERIIAGISGGADSVCLLFVLKEFQKQVDFTLEAVHVEHGIRGEESLRDAGFAEALCQKLGITFHLRSFNVPERAKREKLTVEEAARKCRYEAFYEICGEGKIAVAHNREDQAETILWNLARGSGLRGLCGMRPVNGRLIRPLLNTGRQEIEQWLKELGQNYCTDSTNLSDDYTRNKMRHQVLPALEELNEQAVCHIAQAGGRLLRAEEYLEAVAKEKASRISFLRNGIVYLERQALLNEDVLIQEYILREVLGSLQWGLKDIRAVHIEELKQLAGNTSGKTLSMPGGQNITASQGYLIFGYREKKAEQDKEVPLKIPGVTRWGGYCFTTELLTWEKQRIPEKKYTKWLDYDTIENTIYLRSRQRGDYLVTEAAGGRKKLKKFFIDEKIPQEQRDSIPLLAEGSHILWVVGHRISQICKITEETKQIVRIQVEEENHGR